MKNHPHWLIKLLLVFLLTLGAGFGERVEQVGLVAIQPANCHMPDLEEHAHEDLYFLVDETTGAKVRLLEVHERLKGLQPLQRIRVTGVRDTPAAQRRMENQSWPAVRAPVQSVGRSKMQVEEIEFIPVADHGGEEAPEKPQGGDQEEVWRVEDSESGGEKASGGNSLEMLSTLLVFISTDTHNCMTVEANARGRLFDNATNANEGMQAITKGRYGLQLGNGTGTPGDHVIHLHLNVNSGDHDADSIEDLAVARLFNSVASGGMGLNRLDWNRILMFAPGGIIRSNFTAYAYYPWGSYTTHGMISMYGNSYGNNRMNGFLHELGHNFGFAHSSKGTNEYGDRTCVMGLTNSGTQTETYGAPKLFETNWLEAFPGAAVALTTDATLNLFPLSSDPNVVEETIAISIPGTDYFVAYHRNDLPYGLLSLPEDRDRLFVYTRAGAARSRTFQVANLGPGESFFGPGEIRFEMYGAGNEYAVVTVDQPSRFSSTAMATDSTMRGRSSTSAIFRRVRMTTRMATAKPT